MRSPKLSTPALSLAALVLAACNDITGSGVAGGLLQNIRPPRDEPVAYRNSVKYRDAGLKPATGRAGSATVSVRALEGADRTVDLEITTGSFDNPASARGNIDKVQIKALDPANSNRALWTQNYTALRKGGNAAYRFTGLQRTRKLQVQVNVSGIDFNRVGVVTVVEQVKRRPDLAVADVEAPESARLNSPVLIGATVRELNGDVGARSDCVLYVNGVAADRARGIWVDAGGTVSCAFAHTFTQAGSHELVVALESGAPSDWDLSNNRRSRPINVGVPAPEPPPAGPVSYPQAFYYSAHAEDARLVDRARSTYTFTYSDSYGYSGTHESDYTYGHEGRWQSGRHAGQMAKELAFPLARVEASHASGGLTLASHDENNVAAEWANHADDGAGSVYRESCADRYSESTDAGRIYLRVCSGRWTTPSGSEEWTAFEQWRWAGDVTYRSMQFQSSRDQAPDGTTVEDTYVWNDESRDAAGSTPTLGSTYDMRVMFTLGDGTSYGSSAAVPLTAFGDGWSQPFTCWDDPFSYSFDGYWYTQNGQSCYGAEYTFSGLIGTVTGDPAALP